LLTHPQIADACAVPVRDEEAGVVPKAFDVIPKSPSGELLRRVLVERRREATR
jgi:acyl-CoA synthetase (AMP-forming)/AMP-acid ligase II